MQKVSQHPKETDHVERQENLLAREAALGHRDNHPKPEGDQQAPQRGEQLPPREK